MTGPTVAAGTRRTRGAFEESSFSTDHSVRLICSVYIEAYPTREISMSISPFTFSYPTTDRRLGLLFQPSHYPLIGDAEAFRWISLFFMCSICLSLNAHNCFKIQQVLRLGEASEGHKLNP